MIRLCTLLVFCFGLFFSPTAQAIAPVINLYTMGPGADLFSTFGHAAICVTDEQTPQGRCYNYGTADFRTPLPLTISFLKGQALFWVALWDEPAMIRAYRTEDWTIYRQKLPLSDAEAQEVMDLLAAAISGPGRFYRYHHFHDNCTTRIRDVLDQISGGRLHKDSAMPPTGVSGFRNYVRAGFAASLPMLVLSDLVLGRPADAPISIWQAMFLPEVFRAEVQRRFAAPVEILYTRQAPPPRDLRPYRPFVLPFLGLLCAVLLWRVPGRWTRVLLMLPLSALGLLLWILALYAKLPELSQNEVLLCLWPTDVLLWLLPKNAVKRYAQARLAVLALCALLSAISILHQPLFGPLLLAALPLYAIASSSVVGQPRTDVDAN